MDCSPPGASVHGIFQARILEWVAISSSRGSSRPRDQTWVSCDSRNSRRILYHWATWEALWITRRRLKQCFRHITWHLMPFCVCWLLILATPWSMPGLRFESRDCTPAPAVQAGSFNHWSTSEISRETLPSAFSDMICGFRRIGPFFLVVRFVHGCHLTWSSLGQQVLQREIPHWGKNSTITVHI